MYLILVLLDLILEQVAILAISGVLLVLLLLYLLWLFSLALFLFPSVMHFYLLVIHLPVTQRGLTCVTLQGCRDLVLSSLSPSRPLVLSILLSRQLGFLFVFCSV